MKPNSFLMVSCAAISLTWSSSFGQMPNFVDGTGTEQPSIGPTASLTTLQGIYIADELNRQILYYEDPSLQTLISSVAYPELLHSVDRLDVIDGMLIARDESGIEHDLGIRANYTSNELEWRSGYRADRIEENLIHLISSLESELTLRPSIPNQRIVSWSYVGSQGDMPVFYWVEQEGTSVRALVGRAEDDEIVPSFEVDLSHFTFLLPNPVHMDQSGQLWFVSLQDEVWTRPLLEVSNNDRSLFGLESSGDFFGTEETYEGGARDLLIDLERAAEAQRGARNNPFDSGRGLDDYEVIDRAMIAFADDREFELVVRDGLTREGIIARALAYLTIPFFYRIRNTTDLGLGWEMPTSLVGQSSTWQTGFRYYWSGYMSPLEHQQGIVEGFSVGDIDTSEIISDGIVGCDCSGCVSAWLGIPRHTTWDIHVDEDNLFSEVDISEVEPGDIFNSAGAHVRMLLNAIETSNGTRYRMIESAKSCDGVCIRVYSIEQLSRYVPLRYQHILEN